MVRILAVLFGAAFIFLGVAGGGTMPTLITNGLVFGYFTASTMHNLLYLATGVISLVSATDRHLSRWVLILLGLVYLALGGIGVGRAGDIYFMHNNMFDNYLFTGIAIILLLIGLSSKK